MNHKRFCVFCGEAPEGQDKEHVIPSWLLEHTGDPKRKAFFGFSQDDESYKKRMYAFNSFQFPACSKCNNDFSKLEGAAKIVVLKLLAEGPISSSELSTLNDWLDKVRVGLWLGFLYLDKVATTIQPRFHITTRIRTRDRLTIIYKTDCTSKRINFLGPGLPSFIANPSCFALAINNICIFNVSHFNLSSRRLGYPFARKAQYLDLKGKIEIDIAPGLHRRMTPIVKSRIIPGGTKLHQCIYKQHIAEPGNSKYFENDFVRNASMDLSNGIGKVYQEDERSIVEYSETENTKWLPPTTHQHLELLLNMYDQLSAFQENQYRVEGSFDRLSKTDRRSVQEEIRLCLRSNREVRSVIAKQLAGMS